MKIVLSYRRNDVVGTELSRIHDLLIQRYGPENVFRDIDNILPGADFHDHIHKVLNGCDVLLAIIGPRWVGQRRGRPPRIKDEDDWVRIEVEAALQRQILVVPMLVEGATMPRRDQLPQTLHPLIRRNAAEIRQWPRLPHPCGQSSSALSTAC